MRTSEREKEVLYREEYGNKGIIQLANIQRNKGDAPHERRTKSTPTES